MMVGPDRIIACPACGELAKLRTLVSGNTIGASFWTDGKMTAPMLPLDPGVIACRRCGECYWSNDAIAVGSCESYGRIAGQKNPEWAAAQYAEQPSEAAYYSAIAKRFGPKARWFGLVPPRPNDRDRERQFRTLAVWRRNDRTRGSLWDMDAAAEEPPVDGVAAGKNIEALAALLDDRDPQDRLLKAELYRELGEFDRALRLLDFPFEDCNRHGAAVIRDRAQRRDPVVAKVHGNEGYTAENYRRMEKERLQRLADIEAENLRNRRSRVTAPPWDLDRPRLEQFFTFVCPFCSHAEEIGLWFPSKTCARCSGLSKIERPNSYIERGW